MIILVFNLLKIIFIGFKNFPIKKLFRQFPQYVPFSWHNNKKACFIMASKISLQGNKNPLKKKLSFFEGGHQLEKLEFALAIAQTNGDKKKSISLKKKIVELGGNVEEPGT